MYGSSDPVEATHAVVDKVGDVSLVSRVHSVDVLHVVQVEQVGGALAVVHLAPPLRLLRGDDLHRHKHRLVKVVKERVAVSAGSMVSRKSIDQGKTLAFPIDNTTMS